MKVEWEEGYCVNIVLSSNGYPNKAYIGYEIQIDNSKLNNIFIAGAKLEDNKLITTGGRVLSVVGKGRNLEEARDSAYKIKENVEFEGAYCRSDIGIVK